MTAGQSSSTPNPGDAPPLGGTLVAADAGEGRAEGNGLSDSQQISASFPGRMCANWGGGKSAGLDEPLPCVVLLPSSAITSCGARPPPSRPHFVSRTRMAAHFLILSRHRSFPGAPMDHEGQKHHRLLCFAPKPTTAQDPQRLAASPFIPPRQNLAPPPLSAAH